MNFYQFIDGGITVYGTAGLELALMGKPVILAGEAHYGNKGFTHDAKSIDEYRELLYNTGKIKKLTEKQLQYAKRYAYCYFIQRQIPLLVLSDPETGWWKAHKDRMKYLLQGQDPVIDFVCEKIISGKEFIMDKDFMDKIKNEGYYKKYDERMSIKYLRKHLMKKIKIL